MPLEPVIKDVYRVIPDRPTPKKYPSLFVRRKAGNLLFPCYSGRSDIAETFDELDGLGGVAMQLLADSHFKTPHADVVAERFDAPLWCAEPELPDVEKSVRSVKTFPFERHEITKGVEVIPTPGHRPGGTCFLVAQGKRRVLFTGDEIWHSPAKGWICAPTKAGVDKMRASIQSLKDVRFDVLIGHTSLGDPDFLVEFADDAGRFAFLDALQETF